MSEEQVVDTQANVEQAETSTQEELEQVDTASLLGFGTESEPEQAADSTQAQEPEQAGDSTQEEQTVEEPEQKQEETATEETREEESGEESPEIKPEDMVKVMIDGEWKEVPKSSLKILLGDEELPADELEKGYMRQKAWTQKTQKLKEVLKEVNALKADLSASASIKLEGDKINKIYNQAKAEAQELVGDDFDEYDPKTQAVITERFNALASEVKRNIYVDNLKQQHVQKLQVQDGQNFYAIDNLAEEILNTEYPATVKESVLKAAAMGNMQPMLEIYNTARQRFYQVQQTQTKTEMGLGGNPLATALGINQQPQVHNNGANVVSTQSPKTTVPKEQPPVTESAGFGQDIKTPPKQKETDILELLGMA